MAMILTIAALDSHQACHMELRTADLAAHLGRMPGDNEAIPATTWWALPSTSIANALWSLRAVAQTDEARITAIRVAVAAARAVEHLLSAKDRAVCVEAIEAAEASITAPIQDRVQVVGRAAAARIVAGRAAAYANAYARTLADHAAACAAYAAAYAASIAARDDITYAASAYVCASDAANYAACIAGTAVVDACAVVHTAVRTALGV